MSAEEAPAAAAAAAAAAPAEAAAAAPAAGGDAAAAAGGKSRFELKKWSPVFVWSWDVPVDKCSICTGNLNDMCIECQTKPSPEECTVAWGVCNVCCCSCPRCPTKKKRTTAQRSFTTCVPFWCSTARVPLPLHLPMAEDPQRLSAWFAAPFPHKESKVNEARKRQNERTDQREWEYQKVGN